MKDVTVKLENINDVREFNHFCCLVSCDVDIVSGRYQIDAKSIMGTFSLDLSKPLKVVVNTDVDTEEYLTFKERIAKFIVSND